MKSIHDTVRDAEKNYLTGTVAIGKYVDWSMYETVETTDAYLNSKHISGSKDSLDREKPFFNIVTAAVNVWYRATDIDRKDIRILPERSTDVALAFLATCLLQNWMRQERFGVFLNDWGRALSRYGSAVVKFVEKDGRLIPSVVPWNRFIADPVDFDAIPRIEKFYKTPEQLRLMDEYDQNQVDALIEARASRKNLDGQTKDNFDDFVELYEVHGRLPSYLLQDDPKHVDEKDVTYVQQMHVVSFIADEDGDIKDFTLYKGRERRDPYMLTHLIKEDGRTLSIGAVEYLFDAQWMANHTMKQWKDQLDLASKLIFQTADANFMGRNVLSNIQTGDILIRKPEAPLEPVMNSGHDIQSMQIFLQEWNQASQAVTSTPDALRGNTMPSGTPYSLTALLANQGGSLFELMTENKGFHLEDMMTQFVIPHLKKKMDTTEEVVAILDDYGISELDALYVPKEATRQYNKQFKRDLIEGKVPNQYDPQAFEGAVKQELATQGNRRFLKPSEIGDKTWKDALDGFEMRVIVEVTNEQKDKQAVLTTLSTVLQTVASNPLVLQDPNARLVFNKILTETATVSPLQLSHAAAAPVPAMTSPPTTEPASY
jgi:hypothetical protein